MSGRLITFEGGEGTGKSTQVARLERRLREFGVPCLVTREPGGTPLAERVRAVLLDPALSPGPLAEALLMEAARADLCEKVLRPALAEGLTVLCDRYDDSTLAYQGAGRGLDDDLLRTLNRAATSGLRPDTTLLFDLDREPREFHQRVRRRFLELASEEAQRFVVLDASLDPDGLERAVWQAVEPRLTRD